MTVSSSRTANAALFLLLAVLLPLAGVNCLVADAPAAASAAPPPRSAEVAQGSVPSSSRPVADTVGPSGDEDPAGDGERLTAPRCSGKKFSGAGATRSLDHRPEPVGPSPAAAVAVGSPAAERPAAAPGRGGPAPPAAPTLESLSVLRV
ncbi:hypothetical protein [Streptomyces sp. TP-A0874]|uniref:hypothetical protein n=1 Tax=Streptomyces sp. TP-A0874 TaxID=549819 RepID=UPI001112F7FD|nr:hypothetical protein [Streptomyces sp. TP-A0874]